MALDALQKLERHVNHDGKYNSVPDRTRRVVKVHQLENTIRVLYGSRLVASHPVMEGRRQYRINPGRPQGGSGPGHVTRHAGGRIIGRQGHYVVQRSLAVYQANGEWLAAWIGSWS